MLKTSLRGERWGTRTQGAMFVQEGCPKGFAPVSRSHSSKGSWQSPLPLPTELHDPRRHCSPDELEVCIILLMDNPIKLYQTSILNPGLLVQEYQARKKKGKLTLRIPTKAVACDVSAKALHLCSVLTLRLGQDPCLFPPFSRPFGPSQKADFNSGQCLSIISFFKQLQL